MMSFPETGTITHPGAFNPDIGEDESGIRINPRFKRFKRSQRLSQVGHFLLHDVLGLVLQN